MNTTSILKSVYYDLQYQVMNAGLYEIKEEEANYLGDNFWQTPTPFHSIYIDVNGNSFIPTVLVNGVETSYVRYAPLSGIFDLTGIAQPTDKVTISFYKPKYAVLEYHFSYTLSAEALKAVMPFFAVSVPSSKISGGELGGGLIQSNPFIQLDIIASNNLEKSEMADWIIDLYRNKIPIMDLTTEPVLWDKSTGLAFINDSFVYSATDALVPRALSYRDTSLPGMDINAHKAIIQINAL